MMAEEERITSIWDDRGRSSRTTTEGGGAEGAGEREESREGRLVILRETPRWIIVMTWGGDWEADWEGEDRGRKEPTVESRKAARVREYWERAAGDVEEGGLRAGGEGGGG
jgi:hypothetical protein